MPKQAWKLLPARSCDVFSGMIKQDNRSQGIPRITWNSFIPVIKLNPASFMAKWGSKPSTHSRYYRNSRTQALQENFNQGLSLELLKFVQGISVFFNWKSKAKPIHFGFEWGHLSESFAADKSIETSVTLAFISVRHSSFHVPKCQCTPNKGSVNHCHSSAQIVNLWIQAASVHHVGSK